ncbi:MAG: S-methyl-5'-thioadenosine phosphorylase [Myxococcota bacterium]|nr:S-methyl-5'-thioadenosine phosphorylase [Myxococcota bacterium]
MTATVGIIGGSGFYTAPSEPREVRELETPFGPPSGPLTFGVIAGHRIVFLPRHGSTHGLLPSEIDARANIWALKQAGVERVISVSAVGSLREHIAPGDVVLPRQLIDRTNGRPSTLFGGGVVAHVSLADPICDDLATHLGRIARAHGANVHDGTYVCIEGPQFSTRAESELYRSWGADVVGMTNLPEARIAREAELCYVTLTLPTDYDSWRPHAGVEAVDALAVLRANIESARAIVVAAIAELPPARCTCRTVLDRALVTPIQHISGAARERLAPILARRLGVAR